MPEPSRASGRPRAKSARQKPAASAAPASAPGFLSVNTVPPTQVTIDGQARGTTPLYKLELAPGPHEVGLTNAELRISETRQVTISSGRTSKLNVELASNP